MIVDLAAVIGERPAVVGELAVPGLAAMLRPGRRDRRAARARPAAAVIVELAAVVGPMRLPTQ